MTMTHVLRSRVRSKSHARFWSGGGAGDRSADHNIGDRWEEGDILSNLGAAYVAIGDVHNAVKFYEQALAIKRKMGDRRGEVLASWNLGLAYEKQGDLKKAIAAMQIYVDYERDIGHPDAEQDAALIEQLRARLNQ